MWDCTIFPSSARRGGRTIKKKFPFRYGAAGVVRSAKTWARRSDHPVCAASVASLLLLLAQPPLLAEEGNIALPGRATLIKRLRNMEPEHSVEGLIGDDDILPPGIDSNAACILQKQVRSPDCQTGRYVSIIEDTPHTHVILWSEAAFDIVSVWTTGISRTNDCENHPVRRIGRHQPGVFRPRTGDDA